MTWKEAEMMLAADGVLSPGGHALMWFLCSAFDDQVKPEIITARGNEKKGVFESTPLLCSMEGITVVH